MNFYGDQRMALSEAPHHGRPAQPQCCGKRERGLKQGERIKMSEYLSSSELADLVGCKSNQRSVMCDWLDQKRWKYVESKKRNAQSTGHRDKKTGVRP